MELSRTAGARAGKVMERSRAAAPRAVLDSAAAAGDLSAAMVATAGRVGGSGIQQGLPLEVVPHTKAGTWGLIGFGAVSWWIR